MSNKSPNDTSVRIIRIISTILAYAIMFGVPFVVGIIVGHIFW